MGVIIGKKEQIDEYFASEALSQSTLKGLLRGLSGFLNDESKEKELYYQEKGHFIIGSAVDCILTGEEGQFDKDYHISTIDKKPGEALLSVLHETFDLVVDFYNNQVHDVSTPSDYSFEDFLGVEPSILDYGHYILAAMNSQEYCMSMKEDTRIKRVIGGGEEYFQDLCKAFGKQVISSEEKELIDQIVTSLRENTLTALYFDRENFINKDNVDIYYQVPIYFEHQGIACKALLDLVIVIKDEKGAIISVEPFDLKTMAGSTLGFLKSVRSWRYDIQSVWYTKALESLFQHSLIKPYKFIVESNTSPGKPLIYQIDTSLASLGMYGRRSLIQDTYLLSREVKGVQQLIEEYKWYSENGWEEEKVVKENNGILKINWNEIV